MVMPAPPILLGGNTQFSNTALETNSLSSSISLFESFSLFRVFVSVVVAVFAMSLFSIPVVAIYFAFEAKTREKAARRYARKTLAKLITHEQEMEEKQRNAFHEP